MTHNIENRIFHRKKMDLGFDLVIRGESLPAVVTDLSLNGIGILIKGSPDISAQVLDLKVRDINLDLTGKVVWKREMFSGVRIGVSRMGQLDGRLSLYGFSNILFGIQRARRTGVLNVKTEQWCRKVFFKDGEMVFSSSDVEEEQLGHMLLASGRISEDQYQNARANAKETGRSQGLVLVEMGYIAPQALVEAVRQRVENVIINLCRVDDAEFFFREETLPKDDTVIMKLNLPELIFRGYKKTEHLGLIKKQWLHSGAIVRPLNFEHALLERLSLDERERHVLSLISGSLPVKDILSRSPFGEDDIFRILYGLYGTRVIDLEEAVPERDDSIEQPLPAAEEEMVDPEISGKIERLYREYRTLGYHGILGLPLNSSPAEIKRAYYIMAKEYHPDRYLHIRSESLKEKLNIIFAYINEAYRELTKTGGTVAQSGTAAEQKEADQPADKISLARMKYREGRDWMANRGYEQAMTLFGQAVYLDGSVADYHYHYGIALLRNKKIKDAEASIRKAMQLSPKNSDYVAELGYIYLRLGFKTRAKNAFDSALKLNPSNTNAAEGLKKTLDMQ